MNDNRGFTLVELILAVAILAIVIASAAGLMLSGSRSFAKGSADSSVQSSAELAVNQMEDLIIDVNGGVDYVVDDAAQTESLIMYHVEPDSSGISVYKKRAVVWDKAPDRQKLYCSEWTVEKDAGGNFAETSTVYEKQLLAEHVTAFHVDLSDTVKVDGKDGTEIDIVRSVVFRVDSVDGTGKAAYATSPVITLRNRMMLSSSPKAIFENVTAPDDKILLYISETGMEAALPVRDRVTTVERGKVYNIFAMVSAGNNVNSLCDWKVEGAASGEASVLEADGVSAVLNVDISESNDYLTITASYKTNSVKQAAGVVKVIGGSGKSLDGVKIIPTSLDGYEPGYRAAVTYEQFTQSDIDALDYTWNVNDSFMVESFANKNADLKLNVIRKPENYGKVITITLTVTSPTTNLSVSDSINYLIPPKGTVGGEALLTRAGITGGSEFKSPFWPADVKCEYYFCDIYGNRISAFNELLDRVAVQAGDGYYHLTFTQDLPPENEYYIKVIVYYHRDNPEDNWQYSRIHYIPAVSLWGNTMYLPKSALNTGFTFHYGLAGYEKDAWASVCEYEAADLVCDMPEGCTISAEMGDTAPKTANEITAKCTFRSEVSGAGEADIKSMKIKVLMREHPDIYTYVDVFFQ